jgi:hypothetical protein
MNRELSEPEKQQLERLVDVTSVHDVLQALADICRLKAGHIESAWQDASLATIWCNAGDKIGIASMGAAVRHVSR